MITTSENSIKPTAIASCKRTFVLAKAKATAQDANDTKAMREAMKEAKAQLALADADVHRLACPQTCDGTCRRRRSDENTGSSHDRTLAKRVTLANGAKGWEVTATETNSWYVHCHCE
jgi:hypothetical protein